MVDRGGGGGVDRQVTSRGRWAVGSASDAYIVVSGELCLWLWKSDDVLASVGGGGAGRGKESLRGTVKVKDHDGLSKSKTTTGVPVVRSKTVAWALAAIYFFGVADF